MPKSTENIGVCSWSLQPEGPEALVQALEELKLTKLQLALDPLRDKPEVWLPLAGLLAERGIQIVSAQFGAIDEDYTSPQTIRETGGVVPSHHWPQNLQNIRACAALAAGLGTSRVTSHAGFIPPDPGDPMFDILVGRVQAIADLLRDAGGMEFLLETGQETAETLGRFLAAVDRPHVGVNFDPANMLLYDMGDPVDAVQHLLPSVRQVHIKDAIPPATAGAWGEEVAVGKGRVDWPVFLNTLTSHGYAGDWIIEREAGNQRAADIATARDLLCRTLQ